MPNEEFEKWWRSCKWKSMTLDSWGVILLAQDAFNAHQPEIDALKAEVEKLRADAERYRWLRSNARIDWMRGDDVALVIPEPDTGRDWGTDIDEHIDAAMKETK